MALRGWRTVRFILPIPLLLAGALTYFGHRTDEMCDLQIATSEAAPKRADFGSRPAVLIGDSWAVGEGVPDPSYPAFPTLLAQELHLDLRISPVGGTGYLNGGACGGRDFATRLDTIDANTHLVIFEGGLNDTGADAADVTRTASEIVATARKRAPAADIVILGTPRVPLLPDERTGMVDEALRSAGADYFVDIRDVDIEVLDDRIHPTAEGHRTYAAAIAAALRR